MLTQAILQKGKGNLLSNMVTECYWMTCLKDRLFHSREIRPNETPTALFLHCLTLHNQLGEHPVTAWKTTLICYVCRTSLLNGLFPNFLPSLSGCLAGNDLSRIKLGFFFNSLSCLHFCWWSSSWDLLAESPLILAPPSLTVFFPPATFPGRDNKQIPSFAELLFL